MRRASRHNQVCRLKWAKNMDLERVAVVFLRRPTARDISKEESLAIFAASTAHSRKKEMISLHQ